MVTGGVTPDEVQSYLEAGALAAGLGSQLFPKDALARGDAEAVTDATREALRRVKETETL